MKIVVSEAFCEPGFQRGVQSYRSFLVLWSKNGFLKKGVANISFFNVWLWWLLVDVSIRYKKGVVKKTIKHGCFCHRHLERRKREKRRERPEVKKTPFLHFWGLKNGQEVVPPLWAPKSQLLKSAKKPYFAFPGKAGGSHFFWKRLR